MRRRDAMELILNESANEGCTVLYSTHNLSEVERLASHVGFLHQGVILWRGDLAGLGRDYCTLAIPAPSDGVETARIQAACGGGWRVEGDKLAINCLGNGATVRKKLAELGITTEMDERLSLEEIFCALCNRWQAGMEGDKATSSKAT